MKFLDNTLQLKRGDRVLDFGCGTGKVIRSLLNRIGSTSFLVGVDSDEDRINVARARFYNDDKNVKIVHGSIDEAAEFGPYDVINATHLVHWIPRDKHREILQKIYASLKPGGRFGFTRRLNA